MQVHEAEQRGAFGAFIALYPDHGAAAKAIGASPSDIKDAVAGKRMLKGCRWGPATESGLLLCTRMEAVYKGGRGRAANVRACPHRAVGVPVALFANHPPRVCRRACRAAAACSLCLATARRGGQLS
jgi:hypothetical protein